MEGDLDIVPAKTISLKRPANPDIPFRLLDAELKNKRRERFSTDETVKTKVSKITNDSDLQKRRLIRFSEKPSNGSVSTVKQTSSDTFKQRQIRFSDNLAVNNKISNEDLVDSLKKRRERFGEVTSTLLKKIEVKEKVLQRKARFGQNVVETTQVVTQTNESNKSQKKKIVF